MHRFCRFMVIFVKTEFNIWFDAVPVPWRGATGYSNTYSSSKEMRFRMFTRVYLSVSTGEIVIKTPSQNKTTVLKFYSLTIISTFSNYFVGMFGTTVKFKWESLTRLHINTNVTMILNLINILINFHFHSFLFAHLQLHRDEDTDNV